MPFLAHIVWQSHLWKNDCYISVSCNNVSSIIFTLYRKFFIFHRNDEFTHNLMWWIIEVILNTYICPTQWYMWWVDGFVCPELLHDIHPLYLTLFFCFWWNLTSSMRRVWCVVCFSLILSIQSLKIYGTFGLPILFSCYIHGATPLGWGTHRNRCNNSTFNILV